ncbi:MAG: HEAT repeat domain-containing protein, partial [Candidatus Omnitrophica bacterium]|nr:HEAT repeat domain-containing protein [Candidatus Omnitrophota bacterium]
REEAIESVKSIVPDERNPLLIRMIQSSYAEVSLFAVHQLGLQRCRTAVMPILEWLESREKKQDRIAGLAALSAIGDDRCVPGIEKMFNSFEQDKEVLEQALATLGMYSSAVNRRFLKKCIHSPNKVIREATHLAILKLSHKKWEVFTAKGLQKEDDAKIKMNILSSVRTVETQRLFSTVLKCGISDDHEGVRMMAQTVFKRIRSEKILVWLLANEKKNSGKKKEQILRLLVMYPDDPRILKIYKKNSLQEKDLHLKLVAIEYMGYTGAKESMPFLKSLALSGQKYAFVASVSLSHLLRSNDQELLLEMLSVGSKVNSPIVQMYLRLILRLKNADAISDEVKSKILELTGSSEHNIRYLSLRCLSRWDSSQNIELMLRFAVSDPSRMVRHAAEISAAEMLSVSIDRIEDFTGLINGKPQLCRIAHQIVRRIEWHRVFYREILQSLTRSLPECRTEGISLRVQVIIRMLIRDRRALFLDAFSNLEWSSDEMKSLIRIAGKTPIQTWYGLKPETLIGIYERSDSDLRVELLGLFAKLQISENKLKNLVFSEIENAADPAVAVQARNTVLKWVQVSAEAGSRG